MLIAFWSGTAADFKKLSFEEWVKLSARDVSVVEVIPGWKKLVVKHI